MQPDRYRRVLDAFYASPWAILPAKLAAVRAFLAAKARGLAVDPLPEALRPGAAPYQLAGRVAVVPVFGVIAQRVSLLEQSSGGIGTEALGATLDGLAGDRAVKAIVLAVDSPGGSVFGVPELGAKIRGLRGEKKIVAVADSVAASAAYWLAAQAQEVYVTPGGQVGSVGVLVAHEDHAGELEQAGVKVTTLSAGTYKDEGSPFGPLTDEARAELQSKVDHYYGLFVSDLAKGRGVTEARVRADFGGGRMVTAKDAVTRGMADGVATLEQVLRRLGAEGAGGPGPGAQAPALTAAAALRRARAVEVGEDNSAPGI
jgi:signal peptide peptidase SppA